MADLAAVARITAEAGALALRRWDEGFDSWEKVPGHPVCAVDLEVDALLRQRLSALDPDAGWLSEETVDAPDRLACRRIWVGGRLVISLDRHHPATIERSVAP